MKLLAASALLTADCSARIPEAVGRLSRDAEHGDASPGGFDEASASAGLLESFRKRRANSRPRAARPSSGNSDLDVGIFERDSWGRRLLADVCPGNEFVDCVNGLNNADGDGDQSCADACGGRCCEGTRACEDFTGRVCMDDSSCMGEDACRKATIDHVADACEGYQACAYAGYDGAAVEIIHDSCIGEKSCYAVGADGHIGNISSSCREEGACSYVAVGLWR